jgi:hypothetical protein
MPDSIPLPRLPGVIAGLSGGPAPTYREIYKAACDAAIPVRWVRGRGYVDALNVAAVAANFGIDLPKGEAA